jgi:hypothetical protein
MGKGKKMLAEIIGILPSRFIKKVAVTALSIDLRMPLRRLSSQIGLNRRVEAVFVSRENSLLYLGSHLSHNCFLKTESAPLKNVK